MEKSLPNKTKFSKKRPIEPSPFELYCGYLDLVRPIEIVEKKNEI